MTNVYPKFRKSQQKREKRIFLCTLTGIISLILVAWSIALTPAPQEIPVQEETFPMIQAPLLSQLPELPTGCESATAAMALQYWGIDISPTEFAREYLPTGTAPYTDDEGVTWGCDPREAFPGDPFSQSGWGCYAPVIAENLKAAAGDGYIVKELSDITLEELSETYLKQNIPVLLWVTIDMEEPYRYLTWNILGSKETFTWICPMHCALFVGMDETTCYFNDPLQEEVTPYSIEDTKRAYSGLGMQAVVIYPKDH